MGIENETREWMIGTEGSRPSEPRLRTTQPLVRETAICVLALKGKPPQRWESKMRPGNLMI